jgi:hypothetical protein
MKNRTPDKYCPVTLEPELEKRAALWTPEKRRAVARRMERWVRQLMVSAEVMERRSQVHPPRLKVYPIAKLVLN